MTDVRADALDEYLARRQADGFRIETRTAWQAVIVRRRTLYPLLRFAGAGFSQRRLVVSVDEGGEVKTVDAQPVRW